MWRNTNTYWDFLKSLICRLLVLTFSKKIYLPIAQELAGGHAIVYYNDDKIISNGKIIKYDYSLYSVGAILKLKRNE